MHLNAYFHFSYSSARLTLHEYRAKAIRLSFGIFTIYYNKNQKKTQIEAVRGFDSTGPLQLQHTT